MEYAQTATKTIAIPVANLRRFQPTGVHSAVSKQGAVGLAACGFLPSCCISRGQRTPARMLARLALLSLLPQAAPTPAR